jgi:hypothetical protein
VNRIVSSGTLFPASRAAGRFAVGRIVAWHIGAATRPGVLTGRLVIVLEGVIINNGDAKFQAII